MRTILIDPLKHTITRHELPEPHELEHLYSAMSVHGVDVICLGEVPPLAIDLWVDDEGLMIIPRDHEKPHHVTQGFFVLHNNGRPYNLVAGKALVAASNAAGDTVGLPDVVTPERLAASVAFIPDDKRDVAANIAEAILNLCGCVESEAELAAIRVSNTVLLSRAMALTGRDPQGRVQSIRRQFAHHQ